MTVLPKIEEILLLAIWKLNQDAYGTVIIKQVEKDTGMKWMSGSVYSALARLKKNGYISTINRDRADEGKGRPRIYYELTDSGRRNLVEAQKMAQTMWNGVPDFEKGM